MNITVSLDELLAYQRALLDWSTKRSIFVQGILFGRRDISSLIGGHFDERDRSLFLREIEKWESQNPAPKLIPSV